MGYAEKIFLNAAKDISNSEFPYISSVVNEDNYASMQLHEAFSRKKGVKTFSEEMDSEDELYDAYEDDKEEEYYNSYEDNNEDEKTDLFGNSSEDSGRYSNRVSFLFDVKGLQQVDIDKLEEEENEEF